LPEKTGVDTYHPGIFQSEQARYSAMLYDQAVIYP